MNHAIPCNEFTLSRLIFLELSVRTYGGDCKAFANIVHLSNAVVVVVARLCCRVPRRRFPVPWLHRRM